MPFALVGWIVAAMLSLAAFGIATRRRKRRREFMDRVSSAHAQLSEVGYRGTHPSAVPMDRADPTLEPDGFAHYASNSQIAFSRETGSPVQALCGRVWVPTTSPAGLPVCPRCEATHRVLPERPGVRRH